MSVRIRIDTSAVTRQLAGIRSQQIPFATAAGLTATAKAAQAEIERELPSIFTKVSPFTRRAFAITPATKASLVASVFVKDLQDRYLSLEEFGGTRTPASNTRRAAQALVLPGPKARLNAAGNLPYGYVARLAQQAARTGRPPSSGATRAGPGRPAIVELKGKGPGGKGPGGFFMRLPNDKIVRLISFVPTATYRAKFGFGDRVTAFANSAAPSLLRAAIERALATAR